MKNRRADDQTYTRQTWTLDKRINVPTLFQLLAIVIFCVSFYYQNQYNQQKTEERFTSTAEQGKVRDKQMEAMQASQTQMLVTLTTLTERMNSTNDALKELRDAVKTNGEVKK